MNVAHGQCRGLVRQRFGHAGARQRARRSAEHDRRGANPGDAPARDEGVGHRGSSVTLTVSPGSMPASCRIPRRSGR